MIIGVHGIVYSKDPDRTRAFFRDILRLRSVDAGHGWLIFALPPAEIAAHPDESGGRHELYLMCDSVEQTVEQLKAKGVKITQPITDRGWGLLTALELPGAGELWLYQPKHPMAIKPPRKPARKAARARPRRTARRRSR